MARPARFLVLAHPGDRGVTRVAAVLEQREAQVVLVSADALGAGARWHHRLGARGARSTVRLADGRVLRQEEFDVVFNRLRAVFPRRFSGAAAEDRMYALAEVNALLLSWLTSFPCPVVNPPAPPALSVTFSSLPELLALAGRAGLPSRAFAFASNAHLAPTHISGRRVPYSPLGGAAMAGDLSTEQVERPLPLYQIGRGPALLLEPVRGRPRRLLIVGGGAVRPVPEVLREPLARFAAETRCGILSITMDEGADDSIGARAGGSWRVCGADTFPALIDWAEAHAVALHLEDLAGRRRTGT